MTKILLSIVTVVYNDIKIEKTIQSILPLLTDEIEYIVIDGNSSDGTIDVIKKYSDNISILISEKDNGIYDAMNKAARIASGEFILHINSGDYLLYLPIDELKNLSPNYVAISYPCLLDGKRTYLPHFDWKILFMNRLHHQSTFYRKNIVNYDLKYNIFSDHNLNLQLYKKSFNVKIRDQGPHISNHMCDGISSVEIIRCRKERRKLIMQESGILILLFSYVYRLTTKLIIKNK